MKCNLLILIIFLISINLINADNQTFFQCGGDSELRIYCIGDNENIYNNYNPISSLAPGILTGSGGTTYTNKTITILDKAVIINVFDNQFEISKFSFYFIIFSIVLLILIFIILLIYLMRKKSKKKGLLKSNF